jgi:hypothetical protein
MPRTVEIADLLSDEALERAAEKIRLAQRTWYPEANRWLPDETTAWHRAMVRAALDGALEVAVSPTPRGTA